MTLVLKKWLIRMKSLVAAVIVKQKVYKVSLTRQCVKPRGFSGSSLSVLSRQAPRYFYNELVRRLLAFAKTFQE